MYTSYFIAILFLIEGLYSLITGRTIMVNNYDAISYKFEIPAYKKFMRIVGGSTIPFAIIILLISAMPKAIPAWTVIAAFALAVVAVIVAYIDLYKNGKKKYIEA